MGQGSHKSCKDPSIRIEKILPSAVSSKPTEVMRSSRNTIVRMQTSRPGRVQRPNPTRTVQMSLRLRFRVFAFRD